MQEVKTNNKQENSFNHCRVEELMHTDSIVHQERQWCMYIVSMCPGPIPRRNGKDRPKSRRRV